MAYSKGGKGTRVRPVRKKMELVSDPSCDKFMTSPPMIAAANLLDRCGFSDMINERADWDPVQCKITPGDGAKAMVIGMFLNKDRPVVSGVAEIFRWAPVDVLFDSVSQHTDLGRNTLSRVLDKIYDAGPSSMFRSFADNARTMFDVIPRFIHSDTTTVSVEGAYLPDEVPDDDDDDDDDPVEITYGYSKDKRPDLKQYTLGYAVDENGLLMEAQILDGNCSDIEWNRKCIDSMEDTMRSLGLVYVADSKLADISLLKRMVSSGRLFLTRCPANFGNCLEASVLREVKIEAMTEIEPASTVKNATKRKIWETVRTVDRTDLRVIVVKSSSMDGKGDNAVLKDREKADELMKKFVTEYNCEADAKKFFGKLEKKISKTIFDVTAEFSSRTVEERPRGRPRQDGKDIMRRKTWDVNVTLTMNAEKAELLRRTSEMYVLISNVPSKDTDPEKGMSAEELVHLYSGQWRVEGMFKTVKTPALADGLYLKTPQRAEALLFLINTAVLLRGLMQLLFRREVAKIPDEELPRYGHWNGKLQRNVTAEYFIQHNQGCPIVINSSAGTYRFADEAAKGTQMTIFFMGLLGIKAGEFFG